MAKLKESTVRVEFIAGIGICIFALVLAFTQNYPAADDLVSVKVNVAKVRNLTHSGGAGFREFQKVSKQVYLAIYDKRSQGTDYRKVDPDFVYREDQPKFKMVKKLDGNVTFLTPRDEAEFSYLDIPTIWQITKGSNTLVSFEEILAAKKVDAFTTVITWLAIGAALVAHAGFMFYRRAKRGASG